MTNDFFYDVDVFLGITFLLAASLVATTLLSRIPTGTLRGRRGIQILVGLGSIRNGGNGPRGL